MSVDDILCFQSQRGCVLSADAGLLNHSRKKADGVSTFSPSVVFEHESCEGMSTFSTFIFFKGVLAAAAIGR